MPPPDEPEPTAPPSANDDAPTNPVAAAAKSAIVTLKRKSRFGDAPDLTPEEHKRRGNAADALWRELVRRVAEKLR